MTIQPEKFDCDKYPPGSHCGDCELCVDPIPTPPNEELLKMVEKDPPWLQEWLDEDMEGLFGDEVR